MFQVWWEITHTRLLCAKVSLQLSVERVALDNTLKMVHSGRAKTTTNESPATARRSIGDSYVTEWWHSKLVPKCSNYRGNINCFVISNTSVLRKCLSSQSVTPSRCRKTQEEHPWMYNYRVIVKEGQKVEPQNIFQGPTLYSNCCHHPCIFSHIGHLAKVKIPLALCPKDHLWNPMLVLVWVRKIWLDS